MEKDKKIWKPITLDEKWRDCDTSILDDISDAWFSKREKLEKDSVEYKEFIEQLKREHAIETGIVESLYTLDKGVTETFIEKGFGENYIGHNDTNIGEKDLLAYLKSHEGAINFIFDMVKEEREISTSFIKELHQLVTTNQEYTEGIDSLGKKNKIKFLKGEYKKMENNPTRADGKKILYCPPLQVAPEMDKLIELYKKNQNLHPIILSAWFHYSFIIIHPFQDGNGRVARLLSSLILIKNNLFPFTVLREESKVKYLDALERADDGNLQDLVNYFVENQRRNILKVLNLKKSVSNSLEEAVNIVISKLKKQREKEQSEIEKEIEQREKEIERKENLNKPYKDIFDYSLKVMEKLTERLKEKIGEDVIIKVTRNEIDVDDGSDNTDYYRTRVGIISDYAKEHEYHFNNKFLCSIIDMLIKINEKRYYSVVFMHPYVDYSAIIIGFFINTGGDISKYGAILDIPPYIISVANNNIESKQKNIKKSIEKALTITLSHIANDIP